MRGLLHYELKGISGWSASNLQVIDVSNVINVIKRKRMFMIFNREYPYTLGITYEDQYANLFVSPIVGGRGMSLSNFTLSTQFISKRYKTEKEMDIDYNNIMKYKQELKDLQNNINEK